MAVRWGEVGGALATFLVLVVLPLAAICYFPPDYTQRLTSSGLDLQGVLYQTVVLGVVISAVALAKVAVDKASVSYLLLSVFSEVVSLAFALLVVGVGNIGSLGYSSFRIAEGKLTTVVALDLRVFVWLTVAVVVVSVLQTVTLFREARAERTAAQPK